MSPRPGQASAYAPDTLHHGDDWRDRAACHGADDPDLWFPIGETGAALWQAEEAQAVCRTCPVMQVCGEKQLAREGGVKPQQRYGIWGGMTPRERATEARRRQRARERAS